MEAPTGATDTYRVKPLAYTLAQLRRVDVAVERALVNDLTAVHCVLDQHRLRYGGELWDRWVIHF